jgi:hypothetical protein
MGQYIRVNGDYNIQTREDGIIKLDTGTGVGRVVVTGDLVVQGATTTVEAADLNIRDNLIIANFGETGAGVTLQYSGLQIDRGLLTAASFVYNESGDFWQIAQGIPGAYSFGTSRLKVNEILSEPVSAVNPSGNLLLIGSSAPSGVLTVAGTTNYETQVTSYGDDAIPNKKYVDDAIFNNPTFQIRRDDTRVIISDSSILSSLSYYTSETTLNTDGESAVSVLVDGNLIAEYRPDKIYFQQLKFQDNTIAIDTSLSLLDENIKFATNGTTGTVQFDDAIQLDQLAGDPAYKSGATLVYSKDPELGKTGLFFVNDDPLDYVQQGELVSKNRALLFSMIF